MTDTFSPQLNVDDNSPALDAFAITPSDDTDFDFVVRGIYVGNTGDVVVVTPYGSEVTFAAVPAGMILPVRAIRVNSTNTTASNMVGLY